MSEVDQVNRETVRGPHSPIPIRRRARTRLKVDLVATCDGELYRINFYHHDQVNPVMFGNTSSFLVTDLEWALDSLEHRDDVEVVNCWWWLPSREMVTLKGERP